ncbi:hypothetical protein BH11MYX1_BH11MYX1_50830 [soil metagenome]
MNLTSTFTIGTLLAALTLSTAGCGKKDGAGDKAVVADKTASGDKATGELAPTIKINEADWVVKNLHDTSPLINISMKVPKDAKLEKNGNGGVDVQISDLYTLTVSNVAVSNAAEAIKSDKSLWTGSYINAKALTDEPNGFVYTEQMKDEANGTKYEPETHFAFYVEKDGAVYSVLDARGPKAMMTPGSTFSPALANKVYGLIKSSAKAN